MSEKTGLDWTGFVKKGLGKHRLGIVERSLEKKQNWD